MNLLKRKQNRGTDNLDTPKEATEYLLPYLKREWRIWECACGNGAIVNVLKNNGFDVYGTDANSKNDELVDFLFTSPHKFDCIITNPPFSLKTSFLEKAYSIGRPFAFLLPITSLEGIKRQKLYKENGLEIIFLPKRIDFTGKKAPWFAVAWFTWGLNIGKEMTFLLT